MIISDIILSYFGINTLIAFNYFFLFRNNLLNIIILGLFMDLFYIKYYCFYLVGWYLITNLIYKFFKKNIFLNLFILYFMVFIYYLITVSSFDYKRIFLFSFIPCIFYLLINIIKYEKNKQNINSSNNYSCYSYKYKNK